MALYYQELLEKYGKIDHHDFVCMFFKVYKKWSSTSAQIYHGDWEWKRVLRKFGYDNLLEAAKKNGIKRFIFGLKKLRKVYGF